MVKKYNNKNVYQAAVERMDYIFQNYETIVVSLSGGKDSTVTTHLALQAARKHNKMFYLFFLDQEVEYKHTVDFIEQMMADEFVIPIWFQIHAKLPNPSSISTNVLDPWNPEKEEIWIRPKNEISKKVIDWDVSKVGASKMNDSSIKMYGFVSLIKCMEEMFAGRESVAQIIGLRADESLNRFRAVTKNEGVPGIPWSTKRKNSVNFYPIYDWRFSDVWTYLGKFQLPYNKIYDLFYWKGMNPNKMRLANLIHTKSYECIRLLQEFEPETVDKMIDRIPGTATAQEYAGRDGIYKANTLPERFSSWKEYRDYLLDTLPNQEHATIFRERFSKQFENNYVFRQQVNQILITDINNYKPIDNAEVDPAEKRRQKWMEIL
ncbi:Predicted phosphoadenosine phosphosulfate sulfurtransferase, contains C-terminal DUF3440 domain [Cruoricaptor ignavus]|uniref:Predicted phosphoadenosine phosphosulfate sulfurtransferase, contains C-terminal DUF3440 domain n=1 Tax=Cruoricaptor ignavus TaxID=1118202 RepID=A0A1M6HBR8_9FLAO|nr:phosphoadenosine phosphosulfate reductase family protein [Cruoricaptor ignavus]SHJ19642.1 Predicted phosphoadenosine phosphosulfate sulfurtransferase, contains C-terminal DUF3440 domain [Cruoricaptor ignavus]